MFCCTRKEAHKGQIVNAICLEDECIRNKNQLCCVACLQQEHQSHQINTIRKLIPDFLEAHRQKMRFEESLSRLTAFVCQQFGQQNREGEIITKENIVQRVQDLLLDLKHKVQMNNQQVNKMKSIFKNLNKNNSQIIPKNSSPSRLYQQQQKNTNQSPIKSNISNLMKTNVSSVIKNRGHQYTNSNTVIALDSFSHSSKHPYLNISQDLKTVTKLSHSGHRFAAIGAKSLSQGQHQVQLKIDKSLTGNIMIGLCHQSVVRQKQFCDCYGINNGTYLIGQNGNNPLTAISFHHSLPLMNRKQIVGWNFQTGDEVIIGINFAEQFIYFQKHTEKKGQQQFSMKISAQNPKSELKQILNQGFKLIVLLQSEGDQVTIVERL